MEEMAEFGEGAEETITVELENAIVGLWRRGGIEGTMRR